MYVIGSILATNLFFDASPVGEKIFDSTSILLKSWGLLRSKAAFRTTAAAPTIPRSCRCNSSRATLTTNRNTRIQVKAKDLDSLDDT